MAVNPQAFEQFTLKQIRITENELGRGSYAVVMELEYRSRTEMRRQEALPSSLRHWNRACSTKVSGGVSPAQSN